MWLVYVILWYTTKFLLSFTLKEAHKRLKCHHLLTWNCLSWLFRSITNSVHSFPFSWWSVVYTTINMAPSKFVKPPYIDLATPYGVLRCLMWSGVVGILTSSGIFQKVTEIPNFFKSHWKMSLRFQKSFFCYGFLYFFCKKSLKKIAEISKVHFLSLIFFL